MGGEAQLTANDNLAGIPKEGDIIASKFTVEKVLGVGGMGVVVAARHIHLGQRVAVKFLRPEAAKNKEAVGRFLREARSAVGLQSAHVVRITDVGTLDNGMPYMVMEHLSGDDLSTVLDQRVRLPIGEAVDYVLQACEAIAEAHSVGVVHRDLKPANLFLTKKPDGSPLVKVLDFGISKALESAGMMDQSLTATSSIMGSPIYMSPEQLRSSKKVDSRTDLWALGVILFELTAGTPPFEDETMTGLCAKIVADSPTALKDKLPGVPPAFEAIVMRCLDKDVTRRFQTVGELATALKFFAGSADGQMAADRASRIGTPFRPPQTSAPILTPLSSLSSASSASPMSTAAGSPAASSQPTLDGRSPAATGFAETVATWQTAGQPKKKRGRAIAIAASVVALSALGAVAFVMTRGPSASTTSNAAAITAAPVTATTTATAPEPALTLAPTAPATTTAAANTNATPTAATTPTATATGKNGRPLAGVNVAKPAASAPVASAPTPKPSAAPPPAPPSTASLLDDRK